MRKTKRKREAVNADKSLTQHLREAVRDSKLSVYRVAKDTGVDQSTLNKFVNGDRDNVRSDVADRLYRFFFHPPRRKDRPFT